MAKGRNTWVVLAIAVIIAGALFALPPALTSASDVWNDFWNDFWALFSKASNATSGALTGSTGMALTIRFNDGSVKEVAPTFNIISLTLETGNPPKEISSITVKVYAIIIYVGVLEASTAEGDVALSCLLMGEARRSIRTDSINAPQTSWPSNEQKKIFERTYTISELEAKLTSADNDKLVDFYWDASVTVKTTIKGYSESRSATTFTNIKTYYSRGGLQGLSVIITNSPL